MRLAGEFRVEDSQLIIEKIEPHVAIRLKSIFRQIRTSDVPPISIKLTMDAAEDFEWFLKRYNFKSKDSCLAKVAQTARASRSRAEQIEMAISGEGAAQTIELKGATLREYQARGVTAFLQSERLLIGDDVGLGKTFIALGALANASARPGLIGGSVPPCEAMAREYHQAPWPQSCRD